jgi:hypothetical protein
VTEQDEIGELVRLAARGDAAAMAEVLERFNEAARDPRLLEEGRHPYEIVPMGGDMLKVVAYPCGRPGCPSCGGGPN